MQISELQLTYLVFDVLYYKVPLSTSDPAVRMCIMQPGITSVQHANCVDTITYSTEGDLSPVSAASRPNDPTDCPNPMNCVCNPRTRASSTARCRSGSSSCGMPYGRRRRRATQSVCCSGLGSES